MLPNALTAARALLGLLIPILVLSQNTWMHFTALFLFIAGAVSDFFDGYLARKMKQESALGRFLDPLADKIFILGLLISFSACGYYSIWWIVPIAAREIVITFCRIGWLREGKSIGAEMLGKWKFFMQVFAVSIAFIRLVLGPYLPSAFDRYLYFILMGGLGGALILTLVSGWSFLKANRVLFESPKFAQYTGALGVGLFPFAPGTWGSLIGLILLFLTGWNIYLALGVLAFLVWLGFWSARRAGLNDKDDPGEFVIDEACGIFVTFIGVTFTPVTALVGFLLFRVFDIIKPFPVRNLERIPGYWGILADDLGAAVYAMLVMRFLF